MCPKPDIEEIEKQERLQRAKNKFQLLRRSIARPNDNVLRLVRTFANEQPAITAKVLSKWLRS